MRVLRLLPAKLATADAIASRDGLSFNAWVADVLDRVTLLDAVAQTEGKTGRELLGAIAAQLASSAGVSSLVTRNEWQRLQETGRPKKGVTIRLYADEREALKQHAAALGHTVTSWVSSLVRTHLRKAPLLAVSETEALLEAVRQLAAVGRNLNTVVHRLHKEGRWAGNLDLYADLLGEVKSVNARIEDVLAVAINRAEE